MWREQNITTVLFDNKLLYRYGTTKNVKIRFCKGKQGVLIFFPALYIALVRRSLEIYFLLPHIPSIHL